MFQLRSDNVSVVFNINHHGGTRSLKLLQAAHKLLVWADTHLSSLRAIHIPGHLNKLADALSRSVPRVGEWQLHPEIVQLIWNTYRPADVDLFAKIQSTQCPRWFSLSKEAGSLGLDVMAHSWPSGLLYAFPPFPMIWLVLSCIGVTSQALLLIAPCWPNKPWFRLLLHLLKGSASPVADQTRSPDTVEWQVTARSTSDSEIIRLAVGGDTSLLVCSQGV